MIKIKNMYYKAAAALTVFTLTANTGALAAQTDLKGLSSNVEGQLNDVPGVIRIMCYIIGLGIGISGILKLKEYMEKGAGQANLREPLGKLVVAAFLIALPTIISIALESTSGSGATLKTDSFDIN